MIFLPSRFFNYILIVLYSESLIDLDPPPHRLGTHGVCIWGSWVKKCDFRRTTLVDIRNELHKSDRPPYTNRVYMLFGRYGLSIMGIFVEFGYFYL